MFLWVTLKVKLCSLCNRAHSYCCVPLLRPLVLSNRSHSAIGWQCSGPLPQAPSRHWVTLVRDAVNGWGSGGRPVENELWGRSWPSPWGLQLTGPWASRWAGGAQGTGWGLCPAGLRRPPQGHALARSEWWGSGEPLPHPCLCNILDHLPGSVCGTCYPPCTTVWAAWGVSGPVRSWVPGCLSNDSWAGSGDLALRELSIEICLFLVRTWT